jgi:uncharacterized protein (TIGR02391 family)
VSFDTFVGVEGENNFWGDGFVIEIAPQGRKYFEALEMRDQQERQSETVSNERNTMPKRVSQKESIPRTLQPHQAIELLRRQLGQLEEIIQLHHSDPRIDAWESTTTSILDGAFGKPNGDQDARTRKFARACDHVSYAGMPDSEYQEYHIDGHKNRRALLQAYIDQLEILAPPDAATAIDQYKFHSEIERVSGKLYRDGHYKPAALEAYIRVIDEVKARSNLPLDGDPLMNRAFGCENQKPVIQFNSLQTDAEKDEQKGFMFLYKGIVSLRNSKAHSNRLFNDPHRAHEYLALSSLLMRVLEIATVNRTP